MALVETWLICSDDVKHGSAETATWKTSVPSDKLPTTDSVVTEDDVASAEGGGAVFDGKPVQYSRRWRDMLSRRTLNPHSEHCVSNDGAENGMIPTCNRTAWRICLSAGHLAYLWHLYDHHLHQGLHRLQHLPLDHYNLALWLLLNKKRAYQQAGSNNSIQQC